MRKKLFIVLALLLVISACKASPQTGSTTQSYPNQSYPNQSQAGLPLTEADVPRVSTEDAKLALDKGEAIIVDVQLAKSYAEGHIAGAISVPWMELNLILRQCLWIKTNGSSPTAPDKMNIQAPVRRSSCYKNGFVKVTPILGGFTAWVDAGYPTEK